MAEPLCNNPNALVTPRGLTFKKPCGLWEAEGLGWCNAKDYNDWIEAYHIRIDAAKSQMKDLVRIKKNKNIPLTEEELQAQAAILEHDSLYKELQQSSYKDIDFTSQQYAKKISDIKVAAMNVNCLIQNIIQAGIEGTGETPKQTGIIEGSVGGGTSTATYIGYGAAGIAAYWLWRQFS